MAKVHTRADNIMPKLPKDDSAAEQRKFNESLLKILKKQMQTTSADIKKLNEE